jgi:hypothetical protein
MPDDSLAEGVVARDEIAALAELFDRFEFALDPLSREADEAESQFNDQLENLFESRVKPALPENSPVSLPVFRRHVCHLCREFLRRNRP